ncbi:MAG: response regulator transcription factor [Elusimicrobiota bacterium]|jgi:DNA-binding response OmpR family regulator
MRVNIVCAARDPNRAGVLLETLSRNGYVLTVVQRAKEVHGLLAQRGCDLLLVGQTLTDEDGLALVKTLRSRGPTRQLPIVALVDPVAAPSSGNDPVLLRRLPAYGSPGQPARATAPAFAGAAAGGSKTSLRLAFFQAGADECLSLDQDVAECLARVKAVLSRVLTKPQEEVVRMGPIELNLTSYTLKVSGKNVPLTSKELDLLYVFLSSPNRVLSRPYLIERVWGYNYFGSPRTVDVHVRRLREKLGKAAKLITTVPCVGYKLIPPGSEV